MFEYSGTLLYSNNIIFIMLTSAIFLQVPLVKELLDEILC